MACHTGASARCDRQQALLCDDGWIPADSRHGEDRVQATKTRDVIRPLGNNNTADAQRALACKRRRCDGQQVQVAVK